ncbi:MAG: IclR family transcriptional regulator [Niabella sp.]
MKDKTQKYNAPALEKGLDILETLSYYEDGLNQVDLARVLNRSVSEIFRMLVVLERRGYIRQSQQTDRYSLTTYMFEIATYIPTIKKITSLVHPLMLNIAKEIHQSIHLAIYDDGHSVIIDQVENPGFNVLSVRIGSKIPVWKASSGLVILAHNELSFVDEVIARYPPNDEEKLRLHLKKIRKNGYDISPSRVIVGIKNISVPIIKNDGNAAASITIPYIQRYEKIVDAEGCLDELLYASTEVSKAFKGFSQNRELSN